jgi:hypothetical protein
LAEAVLPVAEALARDYEDARPRPAAANVDR